MRPEGGEEVVKGGLLVRIGQRRRLGTPVVMLSVILVSSGGHYGV